MVQDDASYFLPGSEWSVSVVRIVHTKDKSAYRYIDLVRGYCSKQGTQSRPTYVLRANEPKDLLGYIITDTEQVHMATDLQATSTILDCMYPTHDNTEAHIFTFVRRVSGRVSSVVYLVLAAHTEVVHRLTVGASFPCIVGALAEQGDMTELKSLAGLKETGSMLYEASVQPPAPLHALAPAVAPTSPPKHKDSVIQDLESKLDAMHIQGNKAAKASREQLESIHAELDAVRADAARQLKDTVKRLQQLEVELATTLAQLAERDAALSRIASPGVPAADVSARLASLQAAFDEKCVAFSQLQVEWHRTKRQAKELEDKYRWLRKRTMDAVMQRQKTVSLVSLGVSEY
ncbi:hypothetical protein BCR44DRAFT_51147 [Catenaria anguillulae PL171]|uniref:Uncharacterized protein n=1 Tax=Catenaria anguillulae PL171 TaxID=765915 RepID=A0A1Y2I3A0_9FUNG|nr:hypothetical protein BCR44DRAFT_51147 [Catenaria anguillulae PL171]